MAQAVNFNSASLNTTTPAQGYHGAISQMVNNKYLLELRKKTKRTYFGKKLKAILQREYSFDEFRALPESIQNLLIFNKNISSAEITKFMEFVDNSHEITFKEYSFENVKFKAIFAALGDLMEIEMQAGTNTFVPLSENFDLRTKIFDIFNKVKAKLKAKLKKSTKINGKASKRPINRKTKNGKSLQTKSKSSKKI